MHQASDEELMRAAARGDLDAFEQIVLRYQHLAWRAAYRFLDDPTEAEDVSQEAFLKILEAAPRYRPVASFRSYFYRILTRLCIDSARKKRPATFGDPPEVPDPFSDSWKSLVAKETGALVQAALDSLGPNQKAAMILRHYEGLSYAEIAEILTVTPKAVERLIGRARAALQSRLAGLERI